MNGLMCALSKTSIIVIPMGNIIEYYLKLFTSDKKGEVRVCRLGKGFIKENGGAGW